jgi:hypothetical protein
MLKASVFSLALLLAFTAAPSARTFDDMSAAKKTTHASGKHAHHKYARGRRAAPGEHAGGQQGEGACGGDARRLCKPYLGQGDMAVLGCFKAQPTRLSRGCRALLQGYGQI